MQTTPKRSKDERTVAPSATAHGWDYGPARVKTTVEIAPHQDHFIAGGNVAPKSRRFTDAINPATGEVLTRIATGDERDVDAAVAAAHAAQPKWASLAPATRAWFLFRLARRLRDHAREVSVLETMDSGRPIRLCRGDDLPLATRQFLYHAGWCDKLAHATPRMRRTAKSPKPIGVCGLILSSGRPLLNASCHLAPALACGNTCVVKPSETTSLSALRLAEIIKEIDLPPGVVNVVTGGPETGALLAKHEGVKKISFTGTKEVGRLVAMACAETGTRCALHLLETIDHVVFADAALNQAVDGIVAALLTGQSPAGAFASRVLVEESALATFIKRLTSRLRTVRVADPLDRNADLGPLVSEDLLAAVRKQIEEAREEGVVIHEDLAIQEDAATQPDGAATRAGFWCPPVVMTDVQSSHAFAQAPIIGPVLAVMSFRTPDEALQRANHARGAIAAGVWTDKGAKALAFARGLRTGVVWCNGAGRLDAASPFGGRGAAGGSRVGGPAGLREYLEQ